MNATVHISSICAKPPPREYVNFGISQPLWDYKISRSLGFHLVEHSPALAADIDLELYFPGRFTGLVTFYRFGVHSTLFEDIYSATERAGHERLSITHISIGSIYL